MKVFLVCFLSVFLSLPISFAQDNFYLIDSLDLNEVVEFDKNLLDSILTKYHSADNDTLRLERLFDFITLCRDNNLSKKYNKELKKEAIQLVNNGEGSAFKNRGLNFIGRYFMSEAYFASVLSDNERYLAFLDSASYYFSKTKDISSLGFIKVHKAYYYDEVGEYIKAINSCVEGISVFEKIDDTSGLKQVNYVLGCVRQSIYELDESLKNHKTAYELAILQQDTYFMGLTLLPIAQLYMLDNKNDSASFYLNKAIKLFKKINDNNNLGQAYYIQARLFEKAGNYEKAKASYLNNIEIYRKDGDKSGLGLNLVQLAELEFNQEKFDQSLIYALEGYEIFNKIQSLKQLESVTEVLANIYEVLGDNEKALSFMKENSALYKKVYNEENQRKSIKQKIEYQFDRQKEIDNLKHQQELAIAEQEEKRAKITMLLFGAIAFLVGVFSLFIAKKLKVIKEQKIALDLAYKKLGVAKENELALSNLKALQSQMNPHFIFNALNSVQDLVLLKDIRSSNKYLGKFSDLIRKILLSSKAQFIALDEELEILRLYLDLEKLRFGADFEIVFEANISLELQQKIEIPAMFIQPYIENAIKHGLFHKEGKKELNVLFFIENEELVCIVKDNGVGQEKAELLKQEKLHLHTGFSTEAINERIKLLNITLNKEIRIETINLYNTMNENIGTKIEIIFPI